MPRYRSAGQEKDARQDNRDVARQDKKGRSAGRSRELFEQPLTNVDLFKKLYKNMFK
jgi:hypothetical protein